MPAQTVPIISDTQLQEALQTKIDQKTKPLGALGRLEEIALRIGLIQQTLSPQLRQPHWVVFAGDHGIVEEGVSAYPQEVTWQMVMNFVGGGAAINIFCRQHGLQLYVVDAGVNYDFPPNLPGLLHHKIAYGTANFSHTPAMTLAQLEQALVAGASVVQDIRAKGCNVIGFGEMGIGNTTAASALLAAWCKLPVSQCVGRGTGLGDQAWAHKVKVIEDAVQHHRCTTPQDVLATFGGFEIAQMTGAMLQAAAARMVILVDGFIASAAFMMACALDPAVKLYGISCHQSQEPGHQYMLEYLGMKPLLHLDMRLGEGTGAAVAYPLIQSAVCFLNDMASFADAGVTEKSL